MNYVIFKEILFIMMYSHIFMNLSLFGKIHLYRTKNKHKVYPLIKVAIYRKYLINYMHCNTWNVMLVIKGLILKPKHLLPKKVKG